MTLPSTSSSNLYPDNTTSNYITQLYKNVELRGDWEVALTEFHFPHTFFNVNRGSNRIKAQRVSDKDSIAKARTVQPGYYKNEEDFLAAVNTVFSTMELGEIRINNTTHGAHFFPYEQNSSFEHAIGAMVNAIDSPIHITLGPSLSRQLGYEPSINLTDEPLAKMPLNLAYGLPSHIYIYSDIVEPHMVGDTCVPLLRMVNTQHGKYRYGEEATMTFNTPQYMPLAKNQFDTIQIDLRENSGRPVPFKFGTSAIVLHFRRSPST